MNINLEEYDSSIFDCFEGLNYLVIYLKSGTLGVWIDMKRELVFMFHPLFTSPITNFFPMINI